MKHVLIILSCTLILCCDAVEVMRSVDEDPPGIIKRKAFQMKADKAIYITEAHPIGKSLSNLFIESEGFEHELIDTVENSHPIREVFIADLDSNGFNEIYIVTQAVGSGSYGQITAYASNKDKSLSPIYMLDHDKLPHPDYSGHDTYSIEGKYLLRRYEIYNEVSDSIVHQIRYNLVAGEAGWQLTTEAK
jgi:hypothetical protein